MRLTLNATPADCKEFLDNIAYPSDWDLELLARHCLLTRIETPCGDVAGYIWFTYLPGAPDALDFHIAVHPDYHGRLTRRLGVDLLVLARATGRRTLVARPISSEHADLLLRLGFSLHGPFAVLSINPLDDSIPPRVKQAVLEREKDENQWESLLRKSPTTCSASS